MKTNDEHAARAERDSTIELSIVIPVYRSSRTIRELVQRLCHALDRTKDRYEIVLVDDASPDDSWQALMELHDTYPDRVIAVQLMRNYGQHNALMCGFRHARGRYVITMDDDLQHPPEEIAKLLATIKASDADVVYGVPKSREQRPWRNLGAACVALFYRMVFRSPVHPSAFRIIKKELVEAILSYSLNYTYIDGLLAWNTGRITQVTVDHRPRAVGRSGYSLTKLLVLAFNLFTNFSLLPLQIASLIGLVAAMAGFALGAYYLLQHFVGNIAVPGYASTITAIFVLGGLQLLSLGIIGEYLGRLHLNVNRKPQYTVRSVVRVEEDPRETTGDQGRVASQ